MSVLGAVLAGGRSSRFGSDKAAALLDGHPLLEHAAARLAAQVDRLVIVGRSHAAYSTLVDHPAPGLGPLGGLCAALRHARDRGFAAVVTIGCDLPLIPDDLVASLSGEGAAIVADCPIVGWWPATLAPALEAHLLENRSRAMRHWVEQAGAREIRLVRPLANVNTPADLAALVASGIQTA